MPIAKSGYAGSDWLPGGIGVQEISPLGKEVADLLGDVFLGIYHLNYTSLRKVNWANPCHIEFVLDHELATTDFDELTRLVVLCHDRALRCAIEGAAPRHLRLIFHKRQRGGRARQRHLGMEQAIYQIRAVYFPGEK